MSSIYKRKKGKCFTYTAKHNGNRIRKSTKMTSRKMALKVKDHWDFKLIKGELDFLGKHYAAGTLAKDYFFHYRKFIESRKSENTCSITRGIISQFQTMKSTWQLWMATLTGSPVLRKQRRIT